MHFIDTGSYYLSLILDLLVSFFILLCSLTSMERSRAVDISHAEERPIAVTQMLIEYQERQEANGQATMLFRFAKDDLEPLRIH